MITYTESDFTWITPMTYATKFKNARMKLGISKRELAKRIGACTKQITKWETGKCYPSVEHANRLKKTLHMT